MFGKINSMTLNEKWLAWSKRGVHGRTSRKRRAAEHCMAPDGVVRGYFSDLPLDPTLPETHSLYPSFEHLKSPTDHSSIAVEARIINDMKCHLSEAEFWQVVEHLYAVGQAKGHIPIPVPRRLPAAWAPQRHY